jgi:methylated-DNA-[protein]-cysteine S-methyltransferase
MIYQTTLPSPVGELTLMASDRGLRAILWENDRASRVPIEKSTTVNAAHPILKLAVKELREYFSGERRDFTIPLDPQGTPFQQAAWRALRNIPYGCTHSYRDQAEALGDARKARAVGAANGRNPISIIVPCHRVVGRSGKLVGFAGGLDRKRYLLDLESRHL